MKSTGMQGIPSIRPHTVNVCAVHADILVRARAHIDSCDRINTKCSPVAAAAGLNDLAT